AVGEVDHRGLGAEAQVQARLDGLLGAVAIGQAHAIELDVGVAAAGDELQLVDTAAAHADGLRAAHRDHGLAELAPRPLTTAPAAVALILPSAVVIVDLPAVRLVAIHDGAIAAERAVAQAVGHGCSAQRADERAHQ